VAAVRDDEVPDDIQGPDRLAILRLDPILRPAAVKITRNVRERERLRRPTGEPPDPDGIDGRYP